MEENEPIEERYIDIHEASEILEVGEEELWRLVHEHKVPTHNIAGAFLRFREKDLEELKIKWRIERELFPKKQPSFAHTSTIGKPSAADRLKDLWYFNDFYVVCSIFAVTLLYLILSTP